LAKTTARRLLSLFFVFWLLFYCQPVKAQDPIVLQKFSSFNGNNGDDWVQLYNTSESPVDLNTYQIVDIANHVKSGISCLLGNKSSYSFTYNYLNQDGDTICLKKNDEVIDCACYGNGTICSSKETCDLEAPKENKYGQRDINTLAWSISDDSSQAGESSCLVVTPTPTSAPTTSPSTAPITYSILVNEFLPDPEGSDEAGMPNGEWVEIFNPDRISLYNFILKDKAGHSLTIKEDNSEIYVGGTYWVVYRNGNSSFSLNNDQEMVGLYDPNSVPIDETTDCHDPEENQSWSRLSDDWCLAEPSKGSANHGCIQETTNTSSTSSNPTATPTPTPTKKPSAAPTKKTTPTPTKKNQVLGATTSAEASGSVKPFYDLVAKQPTIASQTANTSGKTMLFWLPWILTGSGLLAIVGGGLYFMAGNKLSPTRLVTSWFRPKGRA
jgi:hypothetical protein